MHNKLKWSIAILLALGAAAGAALLVIAIVNSALAPVVQCAPGQGDSQPPAALVTAADYVAQGDYEFERGECGRALAAYSRALELKPDYAEAYNDRAYTYMTQQDYARALPDLDRALALRPDYVNARMNRGDIYNYYLVDRARAIADYDRVIALGPAATQHSAVCGHRLAALNGGMSPQLWLTTVLSGRPAEVGCDEQSPGY